jgi:CHAT domain-containing protein
VSRRYEADNLATGKWLEQRQQDPILNVLLVVDPTKDLRNAAAEGNRILQLLRSLRAEARCKMLQREEATKPEILECLSSGKFDLLHYAGHAFFDQDNPARSGILCADGEVLTGPDLATISSLPSLVFFNACEAARIRKEAIKEKRIVGGADRLRENASLAEAFLRGGVATYVGTYWPVEDDAAKTFAEAFYRELLERKPLGAAVMAGRKSVLSLKSKDWADYILYGDPDFVLKQPVGAPAETV